MRSTGYSTISISFLIYINDFPEYLTHSKLRIFADDNIINKEITCQDDCKKLQSDLDAAARREADWLMIFHPVQYSPSLKRKHPSNMTIYFTITFSNQ